MPLAEIQRNRWNGYRPVDRAKSETAATGRGLCSRHLPEGDGAERLERGGGRGRGIASVRALCSGRVVAMGPLQTSDCEAVRASRSNLEIV